jgi:hypothetical protein
MTMTHAWLVVLGLALASAGRADGGDLAPAAPAPAPPAPVPAAPPRPYDELMNDLFASFGPQLDLVSATGPKGGPYTAQMVLPTFELGTYGSGFYFEGELTTYGLALVPLLAPSPDNDYSWMVPPAAEDPSVHYVKLSFLSMRFGFALGELGPVLLGFSMHGDARAAVFGVYAGGFDTSETKMGGVEWTQGLGFHLTWDVVERVRLDVAAMPFFGFDPRAAEFFTSWGGRGFADLSWALWPDLFALRASGSYEFLEWTTPGAAGTFHIVTARVAADLYFDLPD